MVHYPRSRRVGSWLYQQFVRLLFKLDVRDTQVGLKLFRREVAEEVLPLLLVKQFAFDLEFLAVARALGYGRIREEPVPLRVPLHRLGRAFGRRAAGADRHGGDLLPAADPPLLPAQARAAARLRAGAGVQAARDARRPGRPQLGVSGARAWSRDDRGARGADRGAARRPTERSSAFLGTELRSGGELARCDGAVPRQPADRSGRHAQPGSGAGLGSRAGGRRAAGVLARRRLALLSLHAREPPLRQALPRLEPRRATRLPASSLPEEDLHPDRIVAALAARGRLRSLHTRDGRRRILGLRSSGRISRASRHSDVRAERPSGSRGCAA